MWELTELGQQYTLKETFRGRMEKGTFAESGVPTIYRTDRNIEQQLNSFLDQLLNDSSIELSEDDFNQKPDRSDFTKDVGNRNSIIPFSMNAIIVPRQLGRNAGVL
jgi:hypothetical protein